MLDEKSKITADARAGTRNGIPVFSLYGETGERPDDDFVHVEAIATRSQRYGWEIDGHVHHGLCQVLTVVEGGVDLRLDDVDLSPPAPCAVVVPASTVHAFRFRPGTEGRVLTFAEGRFVAGDAERRGLVEGLFARPAVISLGGEGADDLARLVGLLEAIDAEFSGREAGRAAMLGWLTAAALTLIARRHASAAGATTAGRPEAALFARFRALVEDAFAEHRPIAWYADRLGVSESRLDRTARAMTGRSAFETVQERLLIEARRKLVYIAAPVSRLAYELGFEDPAYFWRFFRRRTGMTPNEFRRAERRRATGEEPPAADE